ncbi:MAG: hypothetical protein ACRDOH_04675 [Streptosporangiaceae bacterium]
MWAQLITTGLKPGRDLDLADLTKHLQAAEQPGTGLVRSTGMRDQEDPGPRHRNPASEQTCRRHHRGM